MSSIKTNQDKARGHTENLWQNWRKKNLYGFFNKSIWPPLSPDINTIDLQKWSISECDVSRISYPIVSDLDKIKVKKNRDVTIQF